MIQQITDVEGLASPGGGYARALRMSETIAPGPDDFPVTVVQRIWLDGHPIHWWGDSPFPLAVWGAAREYPTDTERAAASMGDISFGSRDGVVVRLRVPAAAVEIRHEDGRHGPQVLLTSEPWSGDPHVHRLLTPPFTDPGRDLPALLVEARAKDPMAPVPLSFFVATVTIGAPLDAAVAAAGAGDLNG